MTLPSTLRIPLVKRRIRLVYLLAFVCIIAGSVAAYASSVTITSTTNAAAQGVYIVANGYYTISDTAYYVVQTSQTGTSQPLAWTDGGIGYVNDQNPGDWELQFTLTINAGGATSHTYTISCYSTPDDGVLSTTPLFTFQFISPATITAGQTMTVIWDVGATSWTAPAALAFTVA